MVQTQCLAVVDRDDEVKTSASGLRQVQFESITKRFGNVLANDSISCKIVAGGIHAVLGENGAGKSTLMKILGGHYQPDSGSLLLNGNPAKFRSPVEARQAGIGMVHQQFTLVPSMTVLENILLGDVNNPFILRTKDQADQVKAKAKEFGIELDLFTPVWRLNIAERQKVEILKLLWRDSKILILDEPTSQLAPFEAEDILLTMDRLANEGRIIVLVTHHIEEILRFSSHVTVLRKGRCIANLETKTVHAQELAKLMVDTVTVPTTLKADAPVQFPRLSIKDVNVHPSPRHRSLNHVSLDLYSGEVLGIAGVIGSGQDEIASLLTGHLQPSKGSLMIDGHKASWQSLRNPKNAAAYVPADAKKHSVVTLSTCENSVLRDVHHRKFSRGPFLKSRLIEEIAGNRIAAFDVRPNNLHVQCGSLSGGNLQRLILARELDSAAPILVAVNPTAGLDLAMSTRIAIELKNAAASGKSVVLISPDLQELLGICDRILVMCSGSVVGVERVEDLDAESLGLLVGGVKLDTVRKLAKFLKLENQTSLDAEATAELNELLTSELGWQRRLAAKIISRLSPRQDTPTVDGLLHPHPVAQEVR